MSYDVMIRAEYCGVHLHISCSRLAVVYTRGDSNCCSDIYPQLNMTIRAIMNWRSVGCLGYRRRNRWSRRSLRPVAATIAPCKRCYTIIIIKSRSALSHLLLIAVSGFPVWDSVVQLNTTRELRHDRQVIGEI